MTPERLKEIRELAGWGYPIPLDTPHELVPQWIRQRDMYLKVITELLAELDRRADDTPAR